MIIDLEHTPLDVEAVQSLIVPLKETKCVPIVRPPKMDAILSVPGVDAVEIGDVPQSKRRLCLTAG